MTYEEMMRHCKSMRDEDGFCRCSSACSGPSYSNIAADHPYPEGKEVFRGGPCRFVVDKED